MKRLFTLFLSIFACALVAAQSSTTASYKIGQMVTVEGVQGVVFQTEPEVKIISAASELLPWRPGSDYELVYATDVSDGRVNLEQIKTIDDWQYKFIASHWCTELGEGWYLPARDELSMVKKHKDKINQTLMAYKKDTLTSKNNSIWSSTEKTGQVAYYCQTNSYFDGMSLHKSLEMETHAVRSLGKSADAGVLKPASKVYKVGDIYRENGKEGVVFEVSADGRHGKIISIMQTDEDNLEQWAVSMDAAKQYLGADSRTDGEQNLEKVKKIVGWRVKYPAFRWCADLGEGWYLPAIEEVEKFMYDDAVYNAVSIGLGRRGIAMPLCKRGSSNENYYWSSTESAQGNASGEASAWRTSPGDKNSVEDARTQKFNVRAVAKF